MRLQIPLSMSSQPTFCTLVPRVSFRPSNVNAYGCETWTSMITCRQQVTLSQQSKDVYCCADTELLFRYWWCMLASIWTVTTAFLFYAERSLQQTPGGATASNNFNPATITVNSGPFEVIATPITPNAPYSQAALQCNVSGDSKIRVVSTPHTMSQHHFFCILSRRADFTLVLHLRISQWLSPQTSSCFAPSNGINSQAHHFEVHAMYLNDLLAKCGDFAAVATYPLTVKVTKGQIVRVIFANGELHQNFERY